MAIINHVFRLQEAQWDFGSTVGLQYVLCFHQYVDPTTGTEISESSGLGSWEPFVPGPVIRGKVGDTVNVTIQNRISDPNDHFVKALKKETLIHWHGIECSNTYDGTPVTQKPFHTGTDFTYKFKLIRPGMFWYHPHWDSMIQTSLGAYGVIIVEDLRVDSLRTNNIIPKRDRTFNIALSDISFQNDREVETTTTHVPAASVAPSPLGGTPTHFIRNIHHFSSGGAQNFGDVQLINGKFGIPFNDSSSNFQQFWTLGQKATAGQLTLDREESVSFYIANTGLHRFYKVHLAFKTSGGSWTRTNNLFRLGGESGLLDEARGGGDEFGSFKIKGWKGRGVDEANPAMNSPETTSELFTGEYLLPTSTRMWVAFEVDPTWTEVALRINGFSVAKSTGSPPGDELPSDMIIAHFNVSANTATTNKLAAPIQVGTMLRNNSILGVLQEAHEDLTDSAITAVTSTTCTKSNLDTNGVIVSTGAAFMPNYDIELTGSGGPTINGVSASWGDEGPEQLTFDNTRYVQKGDVVEWTVENKTPRSDHPFHMHGFSFQPVKIELMNGAVTPLYTWNFTEYVDTIYIPYLHRLTFRFKVEDRPYIDENDVEHPDGVIGRWLAHCHIFKHAHKGMMMNFFVVDGCKMDNFQNTDIYLRDHPNDDGTEPYPNSHISASPDIILLKALNPTANTDFVTPANANSNTLGNEAQKGQDNFIYVRANNRGTKFGKMKTDVYWSPASTLVTPDQWTFIGETTEVTVNPGTLTVAPPITWADADIPASGHYCFIGVTGSENDTKTLSRDEVANYLTLNTFSDFKDLIKNHNNIVWRNFNVVPVVTTSSSFAGSFDFRFRGAFDRPRLFDIVIENQMQEVQIVLPNDPQIQIQLQQNDFKFEARGKDLIFNARPKSRLVLANLKLEKSKDYISKFEVKGKPEELIGKEFVVIQQFINDFENEIQALKLKIHMKMQDLKMAEMNNLPDTVNKLKKAIEKLEKEKNDFEKSAQNHESAERIEVGRITWRMVEEKEKEEKPKTWWELFWEWLLRWLKAILKFFGLSK